MNITTLEKFVFITDFNVIIENKIKRIKNLNLIYLHDFYDNIKIRVLLYIREFARKKKIPLYIADDYKLAIQCKIHGIFISSNNRKNLPTYIKNKLKIIGSAHNQLEYFFKKRQGCNVITLSPLFYNEKYSRNKILNIPRYNLISLNWQEKICPLGGIQSNNLKKIKLTKAKCVGLKSYIFK
jgi:thiamine monophosphate synthase